MSNKTIERIFQVAAAILVAAAVYSFWEGENERVFVFAVLGSLSFFVGVRFQVKERLSAIEAQRREEEKAKPESGPDPVSVPAVNNTPSETEGR